MQQTLNRFLTYCAGGLVALLALCVGGVVVANIVGNVFTSSESSIDPTVVASARMTAGIPDPTVTINLTPFGPEPRAVDEREMLSLVLASLKEQDIQVIDMRADGDDVRVEAVAQVEGDNDDIYLYQIALLRDVSRALIGGYQMTGLAPAVQPPGDVIIEFKSGTITVARLIVAYDDIVAFYDGELTLQQYLNRVVVE